MIGPDFYEDPNALSKLMDHKDNVEVLSKISEIKRTNKERFSDYALKKFGKKVDPISVFDFQIKRMHEYKRQLLNVLKIIALYN